MAKAPQRNLGAGDPWGRWVESQLENATKEIKATGTTAMKVVNGALNQGARLSVTTENLGIVSQELSDTLATAQEDLANNAALIDDLNSNVLPALNVELANNANVIANVSNTVDNLNSNVIPTMNDTLATAQEDLANNANIIANVSNTVDNLNSNVIPAMNDTLANAQSDAQSAVDAAAQAVADSVVSVVTEWAVGSSETVAPTSGWSTSTPARTAGTFIWSRTTTTKGDGTASTSDPVLVTGNTGAAGDAGVSVSSVTPYYCLVGTGASAPAKPTTNPPSSSWTLTEPSYQSSTELYRCDLTVMSDGSWSWGAVSKVSSYTAANAAMDQAVSGAVEVRRNLATRTRADAFTTFGDSSLMSVTTAIPGITQARVATRSTESWIGVRAASSDMADFAITPGKPITVGMLVWATVPAYLILVTRNSSGSFIADREIAMQVVPSDGPGTWMTGTYTPVDGEAGACLRVSNPETSAIGEWVAAAAAIVVNGAVTLTVNDWFDGSYSPDPDLTPSWTGAANASASVLTRWSQALTVANLATAMAQGLVSASTTAPDVSQKGRVWLVLNDAGNVVGMKISNGSVWTSYTLMADQILVPGSVGAVTIRDGAVTAAKIAANTITGNEIAANTITAAKIAANTITGNEIAANSVNADRLVSNSITASQIAANAITASKLAANSVSAASIIAGTITGDKIAANTINGNRIVSGTISTAQLTANGINGDRIITNTLNGNKIVANSITASQIAANTITGNEINANAINGFTITGTVIRGGLLSAGTKGTTPYMWLGGVSDKVSNYVIDDEYGLYLQTPNTATNQSTANLAVNGIGVSLTLSDWQKTGDSQTFMGTTTITPLDISLDGIVDSIRINSHQVELDTGEVATWVDLLDSVSDSGWKWLYGPYGDTENGVKYRKTGKFICLIVDLGSNSNKTITNSGVSLGTLPIAYRPVSAAISAATGKGNNLGQIRVDTSGVVTCWLFGSNSVYFGGSVIYQV